MSNDKPYFPKITATSIDEFQKIQDKLMKLPKQVLENIDHAKNGGVGIECTFKDSYGRDSGKYFITPPSQISDFGDYIGIYCGDFFFVIRGSNYEKGKFNYLIYNFPEEKNIKS